MAIWWNSSRGTTLGVEWELQLIDAASKLLRQDAREVISALRGGKKLARRPRFTTSSCSPRSRSSPASAVRYPRP